MKLGRRFPGVVEACAGRPPRARRMYVERASMPAERWTPVVDVTRVSVPYFSLVVDPATASRRTPAAAARPSLVE